MGGETTRLTELPNLTNGEKREANFIIQDTFTHQRPLSYRLEEKSSDNYLSKIRIFNEALV